MSAQEIINKLPTLSLEEMKELACALREAMEDRADFPDVMAVLENSGASIPMSKMREKYGL